MGLLARLGGLRFAAAALTAATAVQMALIAFGNITDFGTNHAFVQHVLAMDTTFKSPNTMWRAITSSGLQDAAYIVIIAWETVSAIVLIAALVAWIRALATRGDARGARRLSTVGWVMWVLLFGLGFIAIGGEWFEMWQSKTWNGLQPALQNLIIATAALVIAHLPAATEREA
jgi:predicted small integral membrane protein